NALLANDKKRLQEMEALLHRLLELSEKELAQKPLAAGDLQFLADFPAILEELLAAPGKNRRLTAGTAAVVDGHTEKNTRQFLAEATGYLDLGIFVVAQADGRLMLAAGPVLSYFEFKEPPARPLTDAIWRQRLKAKTAPKPPVWTKSYRVPVFE